MTAKNCNYIFLIFFPFSSSPLSFPSPRACFSLLRDHHQGSDPCRRAIPTWLWRRPATPTWLRRRRATVRPPHHHQWAPSSHHALHYHPGIRSVEFHFSVAEDFLSILKSTNIDIWAFMDAAIVMPSSTMTTS